jgi:hypothetical protein
VFYGLFLRVLCDVFLSTLCDVSVCFVSCISVFCFVFIYLL